jgi:hypothetical protein
LPHATGPAIKSALPDISGINVVSGNAIVTFTPPPTRNAEITHFAYTLDSSAGTPISIGLTSPARITGITNMVPHVLYLYAVTSIGMSTPTVSKPFTILYGPPTAPVIKTATFVSQNSTQATFRLAITPPVALNGSAIIKYSYAFDASGATLTDASLVDISGTSVTMTIQNVPNDVSANIYVSATNNAGMSAWSLLPAKVFAIYRAPSAPVVGAITSTATSITIPFTAALANGSPITDYKISVNQGQPVSYGPTVAPITISGLTGKTSYSVVMYAVNALGQTASVAKSIATK